ncbi:hypothetical protein COP2_002906 [Malus domestica]
MELFLAVLLARFISERVVVVIEGGEAMGKVRTGGKSGSEVGAKSFRGAAPPPKAEEIDNVKRIEVTNNHFQLYAILDL